MGRSLFFGFNPPFLTATAVMPVQTDERLIKNDLLQLLLTSPGERVFRPDFGTDLRRATFEPLDNFTIDNITESIRRSIAAFEPRVKVSDIIAERDDNANQISIKLFAALVNEPNRELRIDLSVPIGPATTPAPPAQLAG